MEAIIIIIKCFAFVVGINVLLGYALWFIWIKWLKPKDDDDRPIYPGGHG